MRAQPDFEDQRVDGLLRAGDRAGKTVPDQSSIQLLLDRAVEQADARIKTRRRWLLAPAAVTAAMLGGLTATGALPALAETVQHFAAETGVFGDGGGVNGGSSGKHYTEMDDSEWIELSSPDFTRYAIRLMPTYVTLPATVDRARFARNVAEVLAVHDAPNGAVMQVTGIRHSFEINAACVWYQTWHDAARDGDTALADEAGRQWDAAASWPETVATDGGGVVASHNRVTALARARDWAGARRILGIDCTRADVAAVTR